MGTVPNYNFQTFLTNSSYLEETIDSEGGVVFYAKNDTNYHVDSFYINLLKENSLKQLTNTDPVGISEGQRALSRATLYDLSQSSRWKV